MRYLTLILCCAALMARAETVDVTIRRAPYVISSVSTKSEKAWAHCKYCGSRTSYDRTYKWDVNAHRWVETTTSAQIPDVCRKCRVLDKKQEKLDRKERDLDRKIDYQQTRGRIKEKKRELENLRNANR